MPQPIMVPINLIALSSVYLQWLLYSALIYSCHKPLLSNPFRYYGLSIKIYGFEKIFK